MTVHVDTAQLISRSELVPPPALRACDDRTFEVPTGIYVATFALYFAALAVMAIGFSSATMGIVAAICLVYLVMAFGTPMLWARMQPGLNASKALSWSAIRSRGIMTWTGKTEAASAAVQILLLPVLILFWAVSVVTLWAIL